MLETNLPLEPNQSLEIEKEPVGLSELFPSLSHDAMSQLTEILSQHNDNQLLRRLSAHLMTRAITDPDQASQEISRLLPDLDNDELAKTIEMVSALKKGDSTAIESFRIDLFLEIEPLLRELPLDRMSAILKDDIQSVVDQINIREAKESFLILVFIFAFYGIKDKFVEFTNINFWLKDKSIFFVLTTSLLMASLAAKNLHRPLSTYKRSALKEDTLEHVRQSEYLLDNYYLSNDILGPQINASTDLANVNAAGNLLRNILRSDDTLWLAEASNLVGYLPNQSWHSIQAGYDDIRHKINQSIELGEDIDQDNTGNVLAEFSDRCVSFFRTVCSTYRSYAAYQRVEAALANTPQQGGRFSSADFYERVVGNVLADLDRSDKLKLKALISRYVGMKQDYLLAIPAEVEQVKSEIIQIFLDIDKIIEAKPKPQLTRRSFLKAVLLGTTAGVVGANKVGEVSSAVQARGAREELSISDKEAEVDTLHAFNVFWPTYKHKYLELSGNEHSSLSDYLFQFSRSLLPQTLLYWDGKAESLPSHFQNFFDTLFNRGMELDLSVFDLLSFFRVGAENIGGRKGQNADIAIGKKQIILARIIQMGRDLGLDPLIEDLVNMAILDKASVYDAPRTAQDITLGIHDLEVTILSEAMSSYPDNYHPALLNSATGLIDSRQGISDISNSIQQTVFDEILGSISDPAVMLEELLSDDFLSSLGISDEVSATQLCNYTRCWVIMSGKQGLNRENLRQVASEWKAEYHELKQANPSNALKMLILDQGKLKSFWKSMSRLKVVGNNPDLENGIKKILDQIEEYENKTRSLLQARDQFTAQIGKQEYNSQLQINLGVETVKYYTLKVSEFLDTNAGSVFSHLISSDLYRLSTYLLLNLREIAPGELLVRSENLFPQDRLSALPYNHQRTLESIAELAEMLVAGEYLEPDFTWGSFFDHLTALRNGTGKYQSEVNEYFMAYVNGNSSHRAMQLMPPIHEYWLMRNLMSNPS